MTHEQKKIKNIITNNQTEGEKKESTYKSSFNILMILKIAAIQWIKKCKMTVLNVNHKNKPMLLMQYREEKLKKHMLEAKQKNDNTMLDDTMV